MNKIYLLLGSNMGNSKSQLNTAVKQVNKKIGKVIRHSHLYTTAAWGKTDQPDFLNQVIIAETKRSAIEIMQEILLIETAMGRIRTEKNAPRIIDIDILFFNKEIITADELVIPHKEIPNRRFVLVPLNELSPNFIHPVLQKTIHQLLRDCVDKLPVALIP